MNDGYYDPPEYDETCVICWRQPDECICPECPECGVVGDPNCINTHLKWNMFPALNGSLWAEYDQRAAEAYREAQQLRIQLSGMEAAERMIQEAMGWDEES